MKPPRSVRIGPHRWRIKRSAIDADPDLYGRTVERRLTILLAPGSAPSQLRDTLVHELLHAIWSQCALGDLTDDDGQERVVGSLAPWLLGALRDNPELVAFLTA